MATTTTYIELVNEVLSACGAPELSDGNWANAVGHQRKVKRIIARQFNAMMNRMPDEHWQARTALKVFGLYEGAGGDSAENVGITVIGAGINPDTVTFGGTTDIAGFTNGWRALGAVNGNDAQDCMIQMKTVDQVSGGVTKSWDHSQWYRVRNLDSATQISIAEEHLAADKAVSPVGASPNMIAFKMAQFRVSLPSDFRDFQDVTKPFGTEYPVDLQPMGLNEMNQRIQAGGPTITDRYPRYFHIGYDQSLKDSTVKLGPFLHLYPFPYEPLHLQLDYQRYPTQIDYASGASSLTIDMPEDAVNDLYYGSVTKAKLEIQNDPQGAQIYNEFRRDEIKARKEKAITKSAQATIAPDMSSYRRVRPRHGHERRIWVDE